MEGLQASKERKEYILRDLLRSMTYNPNREVDIESIMKSYQSAKHPMAEKEKEGLLKNLANCINGLPYDPPTEFQRHYSKSQVDELGSILDFYVDEVESNCFYGHMPTNYSSTKRMWEAIGQLDERTGHTLINDWCHEQIVNWSSDVLEAAKQNLDKENNFGMRML